MKHTYGPYDGKPFLGPDELFPSPQLVEFILQYGDQAMDALNNLENPDEQDLIQQMIDAGLLEEITDEHGNTQLRLTARMVHGMQHQALLQIFENLKRGNRDGHTTAHSGKTSERTEGSRPYTFGDPLSDIDLNATLRNALANNSDGIAKGQSSLPLKLGMNHHGLPCIRRAGVWISPKPTKTGSLWTGSLLFSCEAPFELFQAPNDQKDRV